MSRKNRNRLTGFGVIGKRLTRQRRQGCTGKTRFSSKDAADSAIARILDNFDMESYPSPFCRG